MKQKKKVSSNQDRVTFASKSVQDKVKELFDSSQPDLLYITKDKELLAKHIDFINSMPYCAMKSAGYHIKHVRLNIKRPHIFISFRECYEPIYRRWLRLINYCHCESDDCYRFFGKKGVKFCDDFIDCKKFCIWCLTNGLVCFPNYYSAYLVRIDKAGDYTMSNIKVVSEKQLHNAQNLADALDTIILAKSYEDHHHESVSFMTAYTRYYLHDFSLEDAIMTPYSGPSKPRAPGECCVGFSPHLFYRSVADENSCTFSEFWNRMSAFYLSRTHPRPYEFLKKDFSQSDQIRLLHNEPNKSLRKIISENKCRKHESIQPRLSNIEKHLVNNQDFKKLLSDQSNNILEDLLREPDL